MGVTRVFEVITWAGSGPTLTWYWAVFDIFNILQAVAIFIVYVCKRDVLIALRNLFLVYFYGSGRHEYLLHFKHCKKHLSYHKYSIGLFYFILKIKNEKDVALAGMREIHNVRVKQVPLTQGKVPKVCLLQ